VGGGEDPVNVLYLFDIDGTLLHAHRSGRDAFDAVFAEQHGIADASDGIRYGGKTDPAIVEEIFVARLGRTPSAAELAGFLDAYLPRLRALLAATGVQVLAGVVDALHFLADRHCVLGVATGNVKAGAHAKLAAGRLDAWFALGGYGCDSHLRPQLVAKAIERGRERGAVDEIVVVGDTIYDIAASCGPGIVAWGRGHGEMCRRLHRKSRGCARTYAVNREPCQALRVR
jgi:phosphoglycolate phosphatase-like HAD superfamily hydrolase